MAIVFAKKPKKRKGRGEEEREKKGNEGEGKGRKGKEKRRVWKVKEEKQGHKQTEKEERLSYKHR